MSKIEKLNKEFHPWPKERSLYRVKKENPKRSPKTIREFKKEYPKCTICGKKAQADHVETKGSGGADSKKNLLPLCWGHHSERHIIGKRRFFEKYKFELKYWVEKGR